MAKDNVLIAHAQAGDEAAFAELMRAHYAHVYGVVIKIVSNPHDAEEVVQETFFSAYRGLPQLEDRRKFKSWLTEIARNRARDRLRKQRMDTILIDEVSKHTLQTPDTVSDELIRAEQRELIRRAMETLPQKDREIACAYYLDGASYDELIQAHGLSYKAISFRLSRAKQRLIKRLRSMLTALFLPPATTFKQIYSGGLIAMKIGTAPKITVGAIGIIALLFIGVHQMILPKFFGPKDTVSSVQTEAPSEQLVETDTNPETEESVKQPQISDKDMEQINNFFAQFDDAGAQSEAEEARPSTESNTALATTDTDAASEDTEQSAEEVMNAYLEAYKNVDFEALLSFVTGTAREQVEGIKGNIEAFEDILHLLNEGPSEEFMDNITNTVRNQMANGAPPEQMPEGAVRSEVSQLIQAIQDPELHPERIMQAKYGQVEIVGSEYVGNEFHFRLRLSERIGQLVRIQKVDGVWQIYRMDEYMEELN